MALVSRLPARAFITFCDKRQLDKTYHNFVLHFNRQVLDVKYGLKRWQIGEVASKIGQLYYHY